MRIQIYSFLFPRVIRLEICSPKSAITDFGIQPVRSPLKILFYILIASRASTWTQKHGLDLLSVNSALRDEVLKAISTTTLSVHCPICLHGLLVLLKHNLQIPMFPFAAIEYQMTENEWYLARSQKQLDDITMENFVKSSFKQMLDATRIYDLEMDSTDVAAHELRQWTLKIRKTFAKRLENPNTTNIRRVDYYVRHNMQYVQTMHSVSQTVEVFETGTAEAFAFDDVVRLCDRPDVSIAPAEDYRWLNHLNYDESMKESEEEQLEMVVRNEFWILLRLG